MNDALTPEKLAESMGGRVVSINPVCQEVGQMTLDSMRKKLEQSQQAKALWTQKRAALLSEAEQCLANANACNGAIEMLESLIAEIEDESRDPAEDEEKAIDAAMAKGD